MNYSWDTFLIILIMLNSQSFQLHKSSGQNVLSLLDRLGHSFGPPPFLASEHAARHLDQRAGAVQSESLTPRRRDSREVLLGEDRGRGARLGKRERIQTDPGHHISAKMSRVPHGIAHRDVVEVDEARADVRTETM